MIWFKHRSDARNSLKLRKVRRKYGADGYAIYWFCLEAIAYDVDKDNLTFELKEDAETIGFELTIQESRVIEIMEYMVKIDLFERSSALITCMKLAESIDKSMTNSPKMRKWLDTKSVMTQPDIVNTCAELDKNRTRKEIELEIDNKKTTKEDHRFAEFWDLYAKKSDQKKCKAKWSKLKEADINKIMSVVSDYVKSTPDKTYRKNPITWLNGECWNNEIQHQISFNKKPQVNSFETVQNGQGGVYEL